MNSAIANRVSLILSFVGVFIAGVLSISHALNLVPPCGTSHGCQTVANHPSSMMFGLIPVAYVGLGAYLVFAAISAFRMYLGPTKLLVTGGLLLALIGTMIQAGYSMYAYSVIDATCIWCLGSLITMLALLVTQAVIAQNQAVFHRNEKLDLALIIGLTALCSAGLAVMGSTLQFSPTPYDPKARPLMTLEHLVRADGHIYGDPKAPLTIVEFADFYCPGCRDKYPVVKKIIDDHPGRIRLVYRHFPLLRMPGHENSWAAAVLSEYAAQHGKFWEFADTIIKTPKEEIGTRKDLFNLVESLGLDSAGLEDLIKRGAEDPLGKVVYDDLALALKLGINMTPTYFIVAPGLETEAANSVTIERTLGASRYQKFMSANAK